MEALQPDQPYVHQSGNVCFAPMTSERLTKGGRLGVECACRTRLLITVVVDGGFSWTHEPPPYPKRPLMEVVRDQ